MSRGSVSRLDGPSGRAEVQAGNHYNKYESANPIARWLVAGFYRGLERLLRQIQFGSVHEVGCGEGYLLARFAGKGLQLRGSDLSPEIVEESRRRVRRLQPDAEFKVASIYDLRVESDRADLVLCCEVLEHLEETDRALRVLQELAQPYLIASVPREPIWRILNMARGKYLADLGNTPGHLQHWSRRQFLNRLSPYFEIKIVVSPFPWTMVLLESRKLSQSQLKSSR